MKIRLWLSVVLLGASLTLLAGPGVAALPPQTPEPPNEPLALSGGASEEYPFDLKEIVSHSTVTAAPQGGIIDIATDDGEDESDPAVALCAYDQYLVVYERGGEIYGQRLENDGDLLGSAFLISGDAHPDANPDVACDWYYNRFVVVWDHDFAGGGTDYDIRARGVYGGHQTSGSQLYGSEISVSEDGVDEQNPAIACNSDGHTCLVVFEYSGSGNGDVYGQRVSVGSSDISLNGDRFNVSGFGVEEYNPDIAWGGYDDDYLVVWQYLHNDPANHYRIVLAYVWDTNQAGSQIETGGSYLIAQGSYDHHQTMPAAAYNRDTRQYLAAFQYDWYGDGSDYDILALRLTPGGGSIGSLFSVAGTNYDETSPAVAFSGGTQSISGGMGANQFLVTYIYESDTEQVIYGQAIKGTYDTGGNQRDGGRAAILSTGGGPNFGLFNPDVTGSINNGQYMVVWEDMTGGFAGDDYDVLGRIVTPHYTVYLPLVLNDYSSGLGFQPNPDGYSFSNYGNSHYYQDDLGVADPINMFGAAQVCASGSTPADCTLTSAAETWRQQMLNMASGGHCEGLAVTSLRFFKGQTYYTGNTTPGNFQGGTQRVYDLTRDQSIDNYIAYYFSLQDVREVWYPTGLVRENNTPKQILELVRQALQGGSDPYTMGIYKYDSGNLTLGHAITPYDIVDKGGGTHWLYVYDNNYPGQARYIVFNTNNDTWYYTTNYQGNASTHNLDLTRISYRNQEPFTCPFAVGATAVELFLTGGGDMLITNAEGRRIGYDPVTGQVVNEIPDAQTIYLKGVQSPMYLLPLQEAHELYHVTVSGHTITKEVSTNLVMAGPGYVVGFEDIHLQPDQTLMMSLSADGRQLVFEEGQTVQAPKVFMGINTVEP